ncbi:MAG: hypothetical protein QNI99_08345 [Woeseiaceae bacterium]|nr:hypothetical protein [Woeseiaceae bacterium]
MTIKFGAMPMIDNIDTLTIGESTRADVVVALGQPRGNGMTRFSQEPDPREVWFYEYMESDGQEAKLDMLIVFMVEDRYDGHLWFSSLQDFEHTGLLSPPESLGYFPPVSELETGLTRGHSSEEDILAMLGAPTGTGSAILPPDHRMQSVMYYEDVQIDDMISTGASEFYVQMQQRILLVFLEDNTFNGFMWYANAGVAEAASTS